MPRCLIVDNDAALRTLVGDYLGGFGFEVESVGDGRAFRARMLRAAVLDLDIVLLDLMLPDASGLDLCRWLRERWPLLPVIILTAQGDPTSRVVGLEIGADDSMAKPFEPRELVARMHALLRRAQMPAAAAPPATPTSTPTSTPTEAPAASPAFAGWHFDRAARELHAPDGRGVALSSAECRLLSAFVDRPGGVLSREQLLELTQAPGAESSGRSVDLAVSRLRAKLGGAGGGPIRTVRGAGYRFERD